MAAMAKLLGHPEEKFPSVHVAGTNGKGSVTLKIAKAFDYSGYRCGLFTSPHISCFRERFKIGNQFISEDQAVTHLSKIIETSKQAQIPLTYFDYCTLLAFLYFAHEKVEMAVIEVGLGGRFDATNILHPVVSIITSISQDHTELLGHLREEIAKEKAGIIKPFTPVIIGPHTPASVFTIKAAAVEAPLTILEGTFPHYGLENRAIAKSAIDLLKARFQLIPEAIDRALELEPSCRFEVVSQETLAQSNYTSKGTIILDVAHNPDGIRQLIKRLKTVYPGRKYHFALSFSANKDIGGCARLLFDVAESIHILNIPNTTQSRLATPEQIKHHFFYSNRIFISTPEQMLNEILSQMSEHDILIICGSFFIMDSVRNLLGYTQRDSKL